LIAALVAIAWLAACSQRPDIDPAYHEFAYVSNGKSDSVSVIDTLALRNIKTITVGKNPTGLAVNPARNEVYVANTDSNNVSIINTEKN
jgi:YVTN family beta-propeller protein